MEQLRKILLNTRWQYYKSTQVEEYLDVKSDDSHWEWTTLTNLPISNRVSDDVLWMRTWFNLTPTDACVRYFLRCSGCAYPMQVYLRGQVITQIDGVDVNVDVTDYVSLDDNLLVLAIRVDPTTKNTQQLKLYLQPIYCDDLN